MPDLLKKNDKIDQFLKYHTFLAFGYLSCKINPKKAQWAKLYSSSLLFVPQHLWLPKTFPSRK